MPFGALVYVALPVAWDWATGGLENGISIAWLGGLALVMARRARATGPRPWVGRARAWGS